MPRAAQASIASDVVSVRTSSSKGSLEICAFADKDTITRLQHQHPDWSSRLQYLDSLLGMGQPLMPKQDNQATNSHEEAPSLLGSGKLALSPHNFAPSPDTSFPSPHKFAPSPHKIALFVEGRLSAFKTYKRPADRGITSDVRTTTSWEPRSTRLMGIDWTKSADVQSIMSSDFYESKYETSFLWELQCIESQSGSGATMCWTRSEVGLDGLQRTTYGRLQNANISTTSRIMVHGMNMGGLYTTVQGARPEDMYNSMSGYMYDSRLGYAYDTLSSYRPVNPSEGEYFFENQDPHMDASLSGGESLITLSSPSGGNRTVASSDMDLSFGPASVKSSSIQSKMHSHGTDGSISLVSVSS
jgi:hypothetical protein